MRELAVAATGTPGWRVAAEGTSHGLANDTLDTDAFDIP